jgi:tetratricopeptide repeat protein 30
MQPKPIPEGQRTRIIYGFIRDARYQEAIDQLNYELQFCPQSRSMSLLAYCYYMQNEFSQSARVYEQLSRLYPEVSDYRFYLAQSYYKNGDYDSALKTAVDISDPEAQQKLKLLISLIRYEKDELGHAKTILRQCEQEDPDVAVN